jgi:hypothetical protein
MRILDYFLDVLEHFVVASVSTKSHNGVMPEHGWGKKAGQLSGLR